MPLKSPLCSENFWPAFSPLDEPGPPAVWELQQQKPLKKSGLRVSPGPQASSCVAGESPGSRPAPKARPRPAGASGPDGAGEVISQKILSMLARVCRWLICTTYTLS